MATFQLDDIDTVTDAFFKGFGKDEAWRDFARAALALPSWYEEGLDPFSAAYAEQQHRLWQAIAGAGRDYDADLDEVAVETTPDVVRMPGYYKYRHPGAVAQAGEHIRAAGNILVHSNVQPGQWALEYGAGYGLIALDFARLGVNVDTVDISPVFCNFVRAQAEFFRVPLTPFPGRFGDGPRPGRKYDLIYFFESLHHCTNLTHLLGRLKALLAPDGRVIIAGEPITPAEKPAIPYPWGMRLDSETVAVVRRRRWFELGFTEAYLVELFTRHGFVATKMPGFSNFDSGYIFRHRPGTIEMAKHWLPDAAARAWYGADTTGRWTRGRAELAVDTTASFSALEVTLRNHHAVEQPVALDYGGRVERVVMPPRTTRTVSLPAGTRTPRLVIDCEPKVPAATGGNGDPRALGIFVMLVTYRP